jgi:hypothetical protein
MFRGGLRGSCKPREVPLHGRFLTSGALKVPSEENLHLLGITNIPNNPNIGLFHTAVFREASKNGRIITRLLPTSQT